MRTLATLALTTLLLSGCALAVHGPGDLDQLKADRHECQRVANTYVPTYGADGVLAGLDLAAALAQDAANDRAIKSCMAQKGWRPAKVGNRYPLNTYERIGG